MRASSSFSVLGLLSLIAVTSAACGSSDPAPPNVDPGQHASAGGSSQGAAGSPGSSGNTQGSPGAGGSAAGSTGSGTPGAGGSSAGSGDSAGAAGVTGGAGAGGAPVQPPSYPAGPYGLKTGDVVQDFTFFGLLNPKAAGYDPNMGTNISFHDYYNPTRDPSKPRVLIVTASARWCTYCKAEASKSMANYKYWQPKGAEFLTAIFQDDANPPNMAGPTDLQIWASTYKLSYPVVLDPSLSLGIFFDSSAAPWNMVLDLSNMTILFGQQGEVDFTSSNETLKAALGQ